MSHITITDSETYFSESHKNKFKKKLLLQSKIIILYFIKISKTMLYRFYAINLKIIQLVNHTITH